MVLQRMKYYAYARVKFPVTDTHVYISPVMLLFLRETGIRHLWLSNFTTEHKSTFKTNNNFWSSIFYFCAIHLDLTACTHSLSRSLDKLSTFKRQLKSHFFQSAFAA